MRCLLNYICCFLILILNYIKCDIPVHCKREQIEGIWTFRISNEKFDPDLNNPKTTCDHGFPDQISLEVGDNDIKYDSYREIEVNLNSDYKIYDMKNNIIGNWTPVYDEAFIAYVNNSVFTAFMKYYRKDQYSKDDNSYISNCDKTMNGWHVPESDKNNKNWSCFHGIKSKLLKTTFLPVISFLEMNIKMREQAKMKVSMKNMKYDQHDIVKEINSLDLGWKAHIHEEFKGLSFFELKEKLGLVRNNKIIEDDFNSVNQPNLIQKNDSTKQDITNLLKSIDTLDLSDIDEKVEIKKSFMVEQDSHIVKDYSIISKYIDKELNDIDINVLPKNWDWRNVGGESYVSKPRKQLNCGSCYTFSMVGSLESRLRILTNNKDKTEFSRQFPLACSFYTEGCKGGYPIFVAKFFNEFEIIPEKCFEYNPDKVECRNMCDYSKSPIKYFVTKYGYLGGFYGATNEIDLIKEIRARGPIPGNMSVPWGFSYYKSGIFSQNSLINKNVGKFSKTTLFDKNLSWSNVDHSILLVGYGEENGVKYWIGMNTWGDKWGEDGYFRIVRGENDCNIETMGDVARISFKNR